MQLRQGRRGRRGDHAWFVGAAGRGPASQRYPVLLTDGTADTNVPVSTIKPLALAPSAVAALQDWARPYAPSA